MQQSDISGNETPVRKKPVSGSQRIVFGMATLLFFSLYPAIYVYATHLSAAEILANARAKLGSPAYPGLCEALVGHVTGHGGSYASAHTHMLDVINQSLCRTDWENMSHGDIIFWCGGAPHYSGPYTCNPPYGHGWGHIGIYEGLIPNCGPWGRPTPERCYISGGVGGVPGSTVERMAVWPTWNSSQPTCYQSSTDDGTVPPPPPSGGGGGGPPSDAGRDCFPASAPLTGSFAFDPCQLLNVTDGLVCPEP